jgi:tRNA (guanine37-N1)-methyltransferase
LPTSRCLKIPKKSGEKTILLARQLGLFDQRLKIEQGNNSLYIPLSRQPVTNERETLQKSIPLVEFCVHNFSTEISHTARTFVDVLAEELPPHLVTSLPHAVDFIGDIVVLEIPPELERYKQKIGEAVLATNKHAHTILAKASAIEGVYRTRKFEVIAGEAKTVTIHKEYGCIYHVNLSKAYFSPRLSSEHVRVAGLVDEGETVVDMFTGVGPFAIQIARQHQRVRVYAVDVNPDAIELLNKNIVANRVVAKVTPILGDARQVVHERFAGLADRIVMNLPEQAIDYVDVACEAIKPAGGIMHYYEFTNALDPKTTAEVRLIEAVKKTNRKIEKVLTSKIVRATAPYTWQVVVDAKIM